jgi:hypothetical protein
LVGKRDLKKNLVKNIKDYAQFVKKRYEYYQKPAKEAISQQQESMFIRFVIIVAILYPCLYKMDEITRYPSEDFSFKNLDLHDNLRHPCENLTKILEDLFSLLRPTLD